MNETSALAQIINLYLVALAVAIPRGYAMFSFLPVTTRLGLPEMLRAVTIIALILPILEPLSAEIKKQVSVTPFFFAFICLKEALVGTILGIVLGIPFWALETAGNILDFVRQAPDAQLQDPQGATESSITGTLFSIFIIFLFVSVGGLRIIADIIYSSYETWPILQVLPDIKADALMKFVALLDKLFRSALVLAAPILIIVVLAFFILIVIARYVPQINVFDMSMSFRNVAFFLMLPIYLIYAIDYFMPEIGATNTVIEAVRTFLHE
jgi:type III secretion protein T